MNLPLHTALRIAQARRRRAGSRTEWTMCCHQESRIRAALRELREAGIPVARGKGKAR